MLAGFSPEERAAFAGFLERVYLNLRGKAPDAGPGVAPASSPAVTRAANPVDGA